MFEDHSDEFLDALADTSRRALNRAGNRAIEVAQSNVPVKSGRLKKSISKRVKKDGLDYTLEVGAKDYKAHWHEFGTEKMSAHPFIHPATTVLPLYVEQELRRNANRLERIGAKR